MRISVAFLTLLFLSSLAHAGLFDDIMHKAKETADQVIDKSVDKVIGNSADEQQQQTTSQSDKTQTTKPAQQTTAKTKQKYDTNLVKSIQQQLKDQGYLTGSVDGLYGNGTRKAIQTYQQDHGMTADGLPTQALLSQLQSTAGQSSPSQKSTPAASSSSSGWPEPSMAALTLAAVHYRPDALDKENTLKDVLYTIHPETNPIMSNEFKWHAQKAQLKQHLLEEAKTAQLQFEVKPWRDVKQLYRPLELQQYDFDRSGFRTQINLAMYITSQCRLEKQYPQTVNFLAIDADKAEQIDNYFHHNRRIVYPSYRIKVTGADLYSGRPLPIVNFDDNVLKLYARENTPAGNKMKTEYKLLVTTSIPYDKAILTKESAPKEFDNHKSASTDIVKYAVVDGVHLGMDFDAAIAALKANGFEMQKPQPPNAKLGIRVEGKKRAEIGPRGSIEVQLSSMQGKVYEIVERVGYWPPLPDAQTSQKLKQLYTEKFIDPLRDARFSAKIPNGKIAFDDEQREPYSSSVKSPHAEVIISTQQGFSAFLSMTWKGLVGANW